MQRETIHQLISDKNKELERTALRTAEEVINQIAKQQGIIQTAQVRIEELRKELHELEVEKIDAESILGHE
jgi:hypothetical protein